MLTVCEGCGERARKILGTVQIVSKPVVRMMVLGQCARCWKVMEATLECYLVADQFPLPSPSRRRSQSNVDR